MKKVLAVFAMLAVFCSQQVSAQNDDGYYVEATKFAKYLTKNQNPAITGRFDPLGRLILQFVSNPNNTINTITYDYDAAGNRFGKTVLVFKVYKDKSDYYTCDCGKLDVQTFKNALQKVLDRLDPEPALAIRTPVLFNTMLDSIIRFVENNEPIPAGLAKRMATEIKNSSAGMLEVYLEAKYEVLYKQRRQISFKMTYDEKTDKATDTFEVIKMFGDKPIRNQSINLSSGVPTANPPF